jgi:Cof subfamily protein (haloacid dehalogenase superfamily)
MTQDETKEASSKSTGKYKMVALDLDGTLLNSKHNISDASVSHLRYLHKRGLIICIATGRSAYGTSEVIHKLDLDYPNDNIRGFPLVCTNGARGLSVEKNINSITNKDGDAAADDDLYSNPLVDGRLETKQLFHHPVPLDLTSKTLALAKSMGCVTNYYIGNDIYAQPLVDWHQKATERYRELTGCKFTYCSDDYKEAMDRGLPSKLLILCNGDVDIDVIYQQTAKHLQGEAHVIRGSPAFFVEILHKDVCKGNGLEKMCESLGVELEECVSFGDGDNDIEFIDKSGLGIAMKNACENLKSVADDVTEHCNNNDGVIQTLKKLEQSGLLLLNE